MWSPASMAATRLSDAAGPSYSVASAGATSAVEGSLAWAAFKFIDPKSNATTAAPVQLMDTAGLSLGMVGLTDDDWLNGGQLYAYALDAAGEVIGNLKLDTVQPADGQGAVTTYIQPRGTSPQTVGTIEFGDHPTSPDTLGTGVYGLLLATPISVDAVIEHNERLLFQVANHGQSAFTGSYYIEKAVTITDRYPAATRPKVVAAVDKSVSTLVAALLQEGSIVAGTNIASTLPGSAGVANPVPALPLATNGLGTAGGTVLEGQWAIARFSLVHPTTGQPTSDNGLTGLAYATDLRVAYHGAGQDDVSPGSFQVFATDATGAVLGAAALPSDNGSVTLPARATDVWLAVRTLQDNQTERNEQIVFQVNKVDADAFTASHHVEQRVAVKDFKNTFVLTGPHTYAATPVADEFVLSAAASHVFNGNDYAFATIEGYGEGDNLKVDITRLSTSWPHASGTTSVDVTNPRLSVQNLGTLDTTEAYLVLGLHALDGSTCQRGAVYLLGARDNTDPDTVHTFVVIDSNNDGYLTTHSSTHADVVVKLAGVRPSMFDDTDFVLV